MLFVSEILTSLLIGKQNRYVVLAEAGGFEIIGYVDRLGLPLRDTKYCFLCHVISLLLTFDFELIVDLVRAGYC